MTVATTPELAEHHIAALTAVAILPQYRAARALGISDRTLRRWVRDAKRALGATSTINAVAIAAAAGHIELDHLTRKVLPRRPRHPARHTPRVMTSAGSMPQAVA